MKKVLLGFLLTFVTIITVSSMQNVRAEETVIDLYPYDQQACLESTSDCTKTKLGDSHWDVNYNGYNYNIPRGGAQYVSEFEDTNSDGFIGSDEMTGTVWGSVGGIYINNTDSEAVIKPINASRSDLSTAWRGLWAYFDETGKLQMFESFVTFGFDIYNDGDATDEDWRLATEAEVTALDAAETAKDAAIAAEAVVVADTNSTQQQLDDAAAATLAATTAFDDLAAITVKGALIRMKTDAVDTDGYVLEQLPFLGWHKKGVDKSTQPESEWSDIMLDDPVNVVIPAGWSVVSFGTIERSYSPTIKEWGMTLPAALAAGDTPAAVISYDDQPAVISGLTALDDDPLSDGVNVIVDFMGTFEMPTTVSASWVNMLDDTTGDVINSTEMLDFKAELFQDGALLETINYVWNATTEVYDLSAEQTVIDSSVFGSGFVAKFSATTPENDVKEIEIDIAIGVLPPSFDGVEDRFIDENNYIDLMEGITADDGYGNDITSTIELTVPEGFNMYSPNAGEYTMELEFTHEVNYPGIVPELTADSVVYTYDTLNSADGYNGDHLAIYTDLTNFRNISTEYAMIYIVVDGAGEISGIYDRYNWNWTTASGVDSSTYDGVPLDWQADLTLEDDGFVIVVGRYNSAKTALRALPVGTSMSFVEGTPDLDFEILTETSYVLTVDDTTAPHALAVDENYSIYAGEWMNVDKAILANVVGFDAYDMPSDLAIYVSDNGGLLVDTVGTYTVEVTVEDMAGNSAVVEFDVEVVAAPFMEADAQALLDAQTLTETEIQALIDAGDLTEAEIQVLIDAGDLTAADVQALIDASIDAYKVEVEEASGCGSAINGTSSIAMIVGSVVLLGGAFRFFIKRP